MLRRRLQAGIALAAGLILLLVLSLLGVAGVGTAALELRMAGNAEARQLAFAAAETGLERALSGHYDPLGPVTYTNIPAGSAATIYSVQLTPVATTGTPAGVSVSDPTARALHFDVTATGTHRSRGLSVTLTQGVFFIVPAGAETDPVDCSSGSCLQRGQPRTLLRSFWRQDGVD